MTRPCKQCGERFEAKGSWQKLCWRCWRADRAREVYNEGYRNGYEQGQRNGLADATVRAAVTLCHPDRHPPERAAEANRVTAALLELRDGGRPTTTPRKRGDG
jgi:hypothetical protein